MINNVMTGHFNL